MFDHQNAPNRVKSALVGMIKVLKQVFLAKKALKINTCKTNLNKLRLTNHLVVINFSRASHANWRLLRPFYQPPKKWS
jgi:hypothetical protein